jgi:protein SCO1
MSRFVRIVPILGLLLFALLVVAYLGTLRARPTSQYEGTPLHGTATDFSLVDQQGASTSLSALRGHIVVLTFLDTQCHDVCPQTAGQLRAAYRELGSQASSVVFLAVNVNLDANAQSDVAAATKTWQLTEIPTWHFLRGSPAELQAVWKAYGIAVAGSASDGDLLHTASVYIIDASGEKRWYISDSIAAADQVVTPLNDLIVKHVRQLL